MNIQHETIQEHGPASASSRQPVIEVAMARATSPARLPERATARAVVVVALTIGLCIGFTTGLWPVSARASEPAGGAPTPGLAASAPFLELSAFRVVPASGDKPEHLVVAAHADGGDELEYRAVYRNPTKAAVHHVVVTLPVPANGVEYVLESASPRADSASADGKQFSALPLQRLTTARDGSQAMRPAPRADYRFLRWELGDVPAGATRAVSTRVKLPASGAAIAR